MKRIATLAITGALTLAAFVLLALRIPSVQKIPLWFWMFHDTPTSAWVVLFFFALAPLLWLCRRGPGKRLAVDVLPFALFGLALQFGVAYSEGRGIHAVRDRLLKTGHVQFAHIAVWEPDLGYVFREYETFTARPNMIFARSKPPGTVAVYVAADKIGHQLPNAWLDAAPEPETPTPLLRTATVIAFLFPLLAILVLFPLATLARELLRREHALWPLLLYLLCPSFALIPLHLDQTLFPLFQTMMMLVVLRAARARENRRAIALSAGAGALVWASLFLTFSLVPGVILAALLGAYESRDWRRIARGAAVALAVFVVLSLMAYAAIHYDPFVRFRHAMSHHQHFKAWTPSVGGIFGSAALDELELVYVYGVPLMALMIAAAVASVKRRATELDRFTIVSALVLALLPVLSMTQAEVARLWMFMLPSIAIMATGGLALVFPKRSFQALAGVATIELAWMLALKHWADFG